MVVQYRLSPGQVLARAVLALAIILNGTAIPGMTPAMAAPAAGMHTEHQGHDGMPDEMPAGDPANAPFTDCCDGGGCGCGCAVSAAVPRLFLDPAAPIHAPVNANFVSSLHALVAAGAPFRPPA